MNKFTWLDAPQRKDFQDRWWHLFRMAEKWRKFVRPGEVHDIFCNKKDLEQEIIDLEDISLSAYRAMKYLKQYVEANKIKDAEAKKPKKQYHCDCGVNVTYTNEYIQGDDDKRYCSMKCMYASESRVRKQQNICSCGRVLSGEKTSYITVYNKYFCDAHCLAEFESGYESDSYAG